MSQLLKYDAEFASEVMSSIPIGYIDKTLCGCGLTTVALENNENMIIAVPSIELIRNKVAQYPNSRFKNSILGVYGETSKEEIADYLVNNKIVKIMVTYDSLPRVSYLLERSNYKLIIDESNKLLSSSLLKAVSKKGDIDAVTQVFNIAKQYEHKTSFVSATPTPIEYMPKWIGQIPQIKIEWSNTIKAKPILMKRTYPYRSLVDEIVSPLNEEGVLTLGGSTFYKAIIFINSIESIIKTIKKVGISKTDVAIVAGNSLKNEIKIKGYNRLKDPTKLPKFTFITSSGFEGIDLEDDSAISIVVSNTGTNYQMLDILTDLKQAISRQRNKKNPNYDKFIYLYNTSIFDTSKNELLQILQERYDNLQSVILLWQTAKREGNQKGFNEAVKQNQEFKTYTNYFKDREEYEINENLFNSDKYFIVNTREQYKSGFDIKSVDGFSASELVRAPAVVNTISYKEMVDIYNKNNDLKDLDNYQYKSEYFNVIEQCIKLYNKVWKDYTYALNMINNYSNEYGRLIYDIQAAFKIGDVFTASQIKSKLQSLYKSYGITKTAKATDLKEFFELGVVSVKKTKCTKILSKLK